MIGSCFSAFNSIAYHCTFFSSAENATRNAQCNQHVVTHSPTEFTQHINQWPQSLIRLIIQPSKKNKAMCTTCSKQETSMPTITESMPGREMPTVPTSKPCPCQTIRVLPTQLQKTFFHKPTNPHHTPKHKQAQQTLENRIRLPSNNFSHSAGSMLPTSETFGIFQGWQKSSRSSITHWRHLHYARWMNYVFN